MNPKQKRAALWAASLMWMAVIFLMSAAPGDISGMQSGKLTRLLAACLSPFFEMDAGELYALETFVRKGAHMTEYAVLFLLYRASLDHSGVRRAGVKALLMTVGYALTDEFHQSFVPGRGPALLDVAIDGCGALLAWSGAVLFGRIRGRRTVG